MIPADEAIARLGEFDTVIDARSESEFAEDRFPGAVNWPSLNDAERHEVGTTYKQVNPFEARKRGASRVAANISRHIARDVMDKPKGWKPLVYCWRGGQRSGSLSLVLGQIGFQVHIIEGGYKAFRRQVVADLERLPGNFNYHVICGATGSGKSRLLEALAAAGAQVLDLEVLAAHRGSVLGDLPDAPQPTQKAFETALWAALSGFDRKRAVYVESESKKVGNLRVPDEIDRRHREAQEAQARVDSLAQARVDSLNG
jgi:tRNA 2-selenouridine synthase